MPDDPLEALRLTHSQWSSRYLDQIEPEDYPSLLDCIAAAIAAWEKERAERAGDAEGFAEKVDELSTLRAEVLEFVRACDETAALGEDIESGYWASRLRKACE